MGRPKTGRSGCPLNASVEVLGDRWTMIVIRDIAFGDRRTFNELLHNSGEGIASNILTERLRTMVANGLLDRRPDPAHAQRVVYGLTEASIGLIPVIVELGVWAYHHLEVDQALSARILALRHGGAARVEAFQSELHHVHLDSTDRIDIRDQPIGSSLERAYQDARG